MKTLVKYLPENRILTVRNNRRSVRLKAGSVTSWGSGECTVQEDGKTVHVSKDAFERLNNIRP